MLYKRKVKGAGGMFFLVISAFAAFIMITVVNLSRMSTMVAISENVAHIVATKVAISSYNSNNLSYELSGANPSIDNNNSSYYPLSDYNQILRGYGFVSVAASYADVTWDLNSRTASFHPGPIKSNIGKNIRPRIQHTKIENN